MPKFLEAIWINRGFILASVAREFNAKYRSSLLGAIWSVLNPLTMIFIYTFIFSQLMRASLPGWQGDQYAFSIYLCAGVITWSFFADVVTRLSTVFTDNATIVKKTLVPKVCLPVIVFGGAGINLLITTSIFFIFLVLVGRWPGAVALLAIPLLFLQSVFAAGLGVLLGVLHVFFRDVAQFTGVVLQLWFWLTPIVYPMSVLPENARGLIEGNPITPLIAAYQGVFLYEREPDWVSLAPLTVIAILLLWISYRLFMRRLGDLIDEL